MNLNYSNKTLVKHFLSLTETLLTEKQAETAAEIIREAVKKDFLEALEKSEDKLEFLNNEAKEWFWSDTDHCAGNWFFNYRRVHDHIIKKKWVLVKKELKIDDTQIIKLKDKDYEKYLHLLIAKEYLIEVIDTYDGRKLSAWEAERRIREVTPLKKSIFAKDGSISKNTEIYKILKLKNLSKKTIISVIRDTKIIKKTFFALKKMERETVFDERGRGTKKIIKLKETPLGIIWLKERRF